MIARLSLVEFMRSGPICYNIAVANTAVAAVRRVGLAASVFSLMCDM